MAAGTLYSYPNNFRAQKALIAAQYSGASVRLAPDFVFGESNRKQSFLEKFPAGKVPAFESDDGKVLLTESNAIAFYLSNDTLRGKDPLQAAQVLQWLSWADTEVLPASCAWVFPTIGIMQSDAQTVKSAKNDLLTALKYLNQHLLTRTFLVGERISIADIAVFCTLIASFVNVLDAATRKPFNNVNRWFVTLLNQPEFKAVLGDTVTLCETKSEPKPQPQKQQKTAAKTEKPKEAEPMDACEEALASEPPSKDPFDALPKGTFVMDAFKRVYSNESEEKSIPYFFENFDAENYSIWFSEYKYNNELSKVFMSCNLITGMFQRLDKMRKQAFASCCLFGKDDNSTISGVWVWRGQDLAFTLSPDWQIDYESYTWTKLDAKSPETKALVEQYFSWTGKDKEGRDFNQGKIFK